MHSDIERAVAAKAETDQERREQAEALIERLLECISPNARERLVYGNAPPSQDVAVRQRRAEVDSILERLFTGAGLSLPRRRDRTFEHLMDSVSAFDHRFRLDLLLVLLRRSAYEEIPQLSHWLRTLQLPWTAQDIEAMLCTAVQNLPADWSMAFLLARQFARHGGIWTPTTESALREIQAYYASATGPFQPDAMEALLTAPLFLLPSAREPWGMLALTQIAAMTPEEQAHWKRLFEYTRVCEGAKPTAVWRRQGRTLVEAIGRETFRTFVLRWFGTVAPPPPCTSVYNGMHGVTEYNVDLLKGLAWLCADDTEPSMARALAQLILTFAKGPYGSWGLRAANAAIWALSEMECEEAVGQLSRLKLKVTVRAITLQIEKGLETAAKRAGLTKADLEDRSVPTYGFDAQGARTERFGECNAIARIDAIGEITVEWFGANGKPVKAPTAAAKQSHSAELKAFKAEIAAAEKMITAQKLRFDSFYLPARAWKFHTWRERFATHPLLGNIAHRLIWQVTQGESSGTGFWNKEQSCFVDAMDHPLDWISDKTEVRLWHPLGVALEQVAAWRDYLARHALVQPFKQAHREIYVLTEAELQTATYSNRFAAHLLKQHQMRALATLRGWRTQTQVLASETGVPATRLFPEQNLRAEFWIEGVGYTYDVDTTAAGAYLYQATDQVRFYRLDAPENYWDCDAGYGSFQNGHRREAAPGMALADVPPLVFSEVMRDVDLFVGVASVGNDPNWVDGGPEGRGRDYWSDYAFGALSATARTRRDVLEPLLPRLKIAARCTLTDRFLVVRGDLRTYKIHLGSANILMEPNDQYLCIVEGPTAHVPKGTLLLPFEGDQRLAVILSKAFLLAEDSKITDHTITRQLIL